jgi:diaminohydroxyphosphoribosylaminopyrimidine deaminase/5-amino-6-(5-phosphoribosylamino)uracil reductase
VRLPEGETGADPLRVVLDSRLRTPPFARLAKPGTLIITTREPHAVGEAEVVQVAGDAQNRPTIEAILELLYARGVRNLMIEGGGRVAAAFVTAGVVDAIDWFRAPILLGGDGRPGVAALSLARLANAPKFRRLAVEALGDDLWERYERQS